MLWVYESYNRAVVIYDNVVIYMDGMTFKMNQKNIDIIRNNIMK